MSLFERVAGPLTEAANKGTFKAQPGSDAFINTDRWRSGRRNQSPATWFFDKENRRFTMSSSAAARAGALRAMERYHGKAAAAKLGKLFMQKYGGCPSSVPGCPPKRNHGKGGPREDKTPCVGASCAATKTPPDHGGKYPWPFAYKGKKKWDKDWTALGHAKGSQKGSAKKFKFTKQGKLKEDATAAEIEVELTRRPLLPLAVA